jgi:hypothetical protein
LGLHCNGRLLALLTNIRLCWKCMEVTNTLAYYDTAVKKYHSRGSRRLKKVSIHCKSAAFFSQNFFSANLWSKLVKAVFTLAKFCVGSKLVRLSKSVKLILFLKTYFGGGLAPSSQTVGSLLILLIGKASGENDLRIVPMNLTNSKV